MGHFYGMSSYFWEFSKILGIEQQSSLAEAQGSIDRVCADNKDEMETSCFKVTYIMKMLLEGYGFDEATFQEINFVQKVMGQEVNWSLGFVVNLVK